MRLKLTALAIIAIAASSAAQAAPFGPATASIAYTSSPVVTLNGATNMGAFSGNTLIFSTTGSLAGQTTGAGKAAGTINFSMTPGTTVANAISNYLIFNDTTGGNFYFDAASVVTQSFTTSANSTSIALYVLGNSGDTGLNLSSTPTSLTITLNSTGGSAYSASATLSNPPSASPATPGTPTPVPTPVPTPEPVSALLLGTGLAAMGLIRRRR